MFSCHSLDESIPFKKDETKSGHLCFGMLHDVDLQLVTNVSGQPTDPIFKGQEKAFFFTAWPFKNGIDRQPKRP